ncbi:general secretion pathway protein GspE [Myxococcaceae bacterium GXIMD 01537]
MRLGELLIKEKLVSAEALEEALESQVVHGGRLGTNLVELGLLSEQDLARSLGQLHQCAFASGEMVPDAKALAMVDLDDADQRDYLPMRADATRLSLAVLNPHDYATLDAIAFKTGKRVVPVVIPEFRMNQLQRRHTKSFRQLRAIDVGAVSPSRKVQQAEKAKALAAAPDLMSEEEFQSVYAQALTGGTAPAAASAENDELDLIVLEGAMVVEPEPRAPAPQMAAASPAPAARVQVPPPMAPAPRAPEAPAARVQAQPPAAAPQAPRAPVAVPPAAATQPPTSAPQAPRAAIAVPPAAAPQPPAAPQAPMAVPPAAATQPPAAATQPPAAAPQVPAAMPPAAAPQAPRASVAVPPAAVAQPPATTPQAPVAVPPAGAPQAPRMPVAVPPGAVVSPAAMPPQARPPAQGVPPSMPVPPGAQPRPAAPMAVAPPPVPAASPLTFAEAQAELARVSDREDVATTVLRFALGKWKRNLLLSVQGSLVTGWHGIGQGVHDAAVRRIGIALRDESTFRLVRDTRSHYVGPVRRDAAMQLFYKLLGDGFPKTAVILPLLVRGKVVHLLYVDNGADQFTTPDVGELIILAQSVGRSYEAMIRRRKGA